VVTVISLMEFNDIAENILLVNQQALYQLKLPSGRFAHLEKQHNDLVIRFSPIPQDQAAVSRSARSAINRYRSRDLFITN
jgi:hypothetical protein